MSVWGDFHKLEDELERRGLGELLEMHLGDLRMAIEDLDGERDDAKDEAEEARSECEQLVFEARREAEELYRLLEQLGASRRDVEVALGHIDPAEHLRCAS